MTSKPTVLGTLLVTIIVINVFALVMHTTYTAYQRSEDARDIEILEFLPSGADKVDYISEDMIDAAAYQMVDMQEGSARRNTEFPDEEHLYTFMKWATNDLKAFGIGFYENNDLYVLKHKKEVEEFQFNDTETFEELESYNEVKIYRFNYHSGNNKGTIYFARKGKYVVHSSSVDLLKKSLDLIDGDESETAYDEFEHLIERIPKKFWGALALEHIKKPEAKIPYLAGGRTHGITYLERLRYTKIIVSDPRRLNGGRAGGLGFSPALHYVVLQCVDEKCTEEYSDVLYEMKSFDMEIEGNYIHAKKFAWDSDGKYHYIHSGMFPYTEGYLGLFMFFGYEWRGEEVGTQYSIQSPEFPMKTTANKGIQSPFSG